jgi:hypothetical protein
MSPCRRPPSPRRVIPLTGGFSALAPRENPQRAGRTLLFRRIRGWFVRPPARPGSRPWSVGRPPGVGASRPGSGGRSSPPWPRPARVPVHGPDRRHPRARLRAEPGRRSRPGRTWRTHQPGPSASDCSRPSAAERGICGIAVLGEWRRSGQRPGVTNPRPPPVTITPTALHHYQGPNSKASGTQLRGLVWVDLQAITITETPRPTAGGPGPRLVVMAWRSGRPRGNTHGTGDGRPPTADCRLPTGDRGPGTATGLSHRVAGYRALTRADNRQRAGLSVAVAPAPAVPRGQTCGLPTGNRGTADGRPPTADCRSGTATGLSP